MRKLVLAGLVGGVVTLGVAQARAQEMHRGEGWHDHAYLGFLQGVTLTDAQRTQLHQIMQANWRQMKPQRQTLRSLREQIGDDLASTTAVSAAQLAALQQQAETVRVQLDQARLEAALQVRELLTADQLSRSESVHAQLVTLHQQERSVLARPQGVAAPQ